MRTAKSYSIVDHALLHGGYFQRLNHQALSLYLFLLVVGDREGKSYYSERAIGEILHFTGNNLTDARRQLIEEGLISWRSPYFWVKNLNPSFKQTPFNLSVKEQKFEDEQRLKLLLEQLEQQGVGK